MNLRFFNSVITLALVLTMACKVKKTAAPEAASGKAEADKAPQVLDDPNNPLKLADKDVKATATDPVITYCTKETAPGTTNLRIRTYWTSSAPVPISRYT